MTGKALIALTGRIRVQAAFGADSNSPAVVICEGVGNLCP
jgi:hypothetical protein